MGENWLTTVMTDKRVAAIPDAPWAGPVPLVLVATCYAPYTQVPLPTGELVLLDPGTERTFLDAFVTVGLAELPVGG